jgi:hypothetical protein
VDAVSRDMNRCRQYIHKQIIYTFNCEISSLGGSDAFRPRLTPASFCLMHLFRISAEQHSSDPENPHFVFSPGESRGGLDSDSCSEFRGKLQTRYMNPATAPPKPRPRGASRRGRLWSRCHRFFSIDLSKSYQQHIIFFFHHTSWLLTSI